MEGGLFLRQVSLQRLCVAMCSNTCHCVGDGSYSNRSGSALLLFVRILLPRAAGCQLACLAFMHACSRYGLHLSSFAIATFTALLVVMALVTNVSKIGNFSQSFFSHNLSNFSRRRLYEIAAQQTLNLTNRRRRKTLYDCMLFVYEFSKFLSTCEVLVQIRQVREC